MSSFDFFHHPQKNEALTDTENLSQLINKTKELLSSLQHSASILATMQSSHNKGPKYIENFKQILQAISVADRAMQVLSADEKAFDTEVEQEKTGLDRHSGQYHL